jgi:hypothetical protein
MPASESWVPPIGLLLYALRYQMHLELSLVLPQTPRCKYPAYSSASVYPILGLALLLPHCLGVLFLVPWVALPDPGLA